MKPLSLLLLALAFAGCVPEERTILCPGLDAKAFEIQVKTKDGWRDLTECIDCRWANTSEARFVCFGVTYTASAQESHGGSGVVVIEFDKGGYGGGAYRSGTTTVRIIGVGGGYSRESKP